MAFNHKRAMKREVCYVSEQITVLRFRMDVVVEWHIAGVPCVREQKILFYTHTKKNCRVV